VEDISSKGDGEMGVWVVFEAEWFQFWPGVYRGKNVGCGEDVGGYLVGNDETAAVYPC
jgi:hypothetical protein